MLIKFTFLLKGIIDIQQKENSIYIYLIKNSLLNNQTIQADTLIHRFTREKIRKSQLKKSADIRETDVFVEDVTPLENVAV